MSQHALHIASVTKQYGGLRPFRIAQLTIPPGGQVAIVGADLAAAEMMTALVTGASLPDVGTVSLFGRSTADVLNSDDWLAFIDQIGVVSERSALLESLTVVQNVAMPFTLEIDPLPDDLRAAAVALAREAGVPEEATDAPVASLARATQIRVRLARALALQPRLVILEHPNAYLEKAHALSMAADLRAIATRRRLTTLLLTADLEFAMVAAARVLKWEPATGKLREQRRWFSRSS